MVIECEVFGSLFSASRQARQCQSHRVRALSESWEAHPSCVTQFRGHGPVPQAQKLEQQFLMDVEHLRRSCSTACAGPNVLSGKPCRNNAPVGMDTSMGQSERIASGTRSMSVPFLGGERGGPARGPGCLGAPLCCQLRLLIRTPRRAP